jgi:voltage-gated potassium channel
MSTRAPVAPLLAPRVRRAIAAVGLVFAVGTLGYLAFGFSALDALYQTVTTVTTVGFAEIRPLGPGGRVFTMALIVGGTGTVLYALGALFEAALEGHLRDQLGRRKMERTVASLRDHVIVCGWGRVGRAFAEFVGEGRPVVVVDANPERLEGIGWPVVLGDATEDDVLRRAGIERARALVAALDTDAGNLFVTVSARALRPDMFVVARARVDTSEEKLRRAGADRVVNPQRIGGARMAAFVLQPNVAEFLDVVMHDGSLEFRLEEVRVESRSSLAGTSLRAAHLRDRTGALVLALRHPDGAFTTNPEPDALITAGDVLIAVGTAQQLAALDALVR